MGLTSLPLVGGSLGPIKSDRSLQVPDPTYDLAAAEWNAAAQAIEDVCNEVGVHAGAAGSLNARLDAILPGLGAQLLAPAGTIAAPGLAVGELDTGLSVVAGANDRLSISLGGVEALGISQADAGTAVFDFAKLSLNAAGQSGAGGWNALVIDAVNAGAGSGAKRLLDLRVGGAPVAWVDSTGRLRLVGGSIPSPGLSFDGSGTGVSANAGVLNFSALGTRTGAIDASGVVSADGTVTNPGFHFLGAGGDTAGFSWNPGGSRLEISVSGVRRGYIDATNGIVSDTKFAATTDFIAGSIYGFTWSGRTSTYVLSPANKQVALRTGTTASALLLKDQQPANGSGIHDFATLSLDASLQATAGDGWNALRIDATDGTGTGEDSLIYTTLNGGFVFRVTGTGRVAPVNGSATSPVYAFNASGSTGMWWDSTNTALAFSVSGVERFKIKSGQAWGENGTSALPFYSFISSTGSGMLWTGSALGFSNAGTLRLQVTTSGITVTSNVTANATLMDKGVEGAPSHSFSAHTTSGMRYDDVSGRLSFSEAGTQVIAFDATMASDETAMWLLHSDKGTPTLSRVSVGADDTGDPGFKVLQIPN